MEFIDPCNLDDKEKLREYLFGYLTKKRKKKFKQVLDNRTRYITVVLEDIFQPHNASAVLRSCDCFGVQDVHVIENKNEYQINKDVAVGSSKWLTFKKYNKKKENTLDCFNLLRKKGYKIVATSSHKADSYIEDLPLDNKVAMVFGTELDGLSETALKNADSRVKIPMYGFTESYNISVSVALSLYKLTERLKDRKLKWRLSSKERLDLGIEWALKTIPRSKLMLERYLELKA